jgi:hypothetical protein
VKGALVTTLIQCTSVWFAGSKFGLSWKAKQIRMDKVPESIRGYAFLDDDDAPARSSVKPVAPAANKFAALDTDAEDEAEAEEDDAFDVPAPVKPSVLSAVTPKAPAPVPAATVDDDGEDHEPIPVPKKAVTTVKKVVAKTVKKVA